MELRRFNPGEIYLTQTDAAAVLKFFWPDESIAASQLTVSDVGFAQGLLVEAIDDSYAEGYVEIVFRLFYGYVPENFADIRGVVMKLVRQAAEHWFQHATGKDLKDPKIYENVRASLARNFKSVWKLREESGDLIY